MSGYYADAVARVEQYAKLRNLVHDEQLGSGWDGIVYSTRKPSVIKALRHEQLYRNELAVYRRLKDHQVREVVGLTVPRLIGHHPGLWVIEMTLVSPPFILDFAGASLDRPSADFPKHVLREWEAEKRDIFGSHWPRVRQLMSEFRRMGIHLSDVHRRNINFGDEDCGEEE